MKKIHKVTYEDGRTITLGDIGMHTHWGAPDKMIDSQFGVIPEREWCERERERCAGFGNQLHIVTREDGQCALTRK